MDILFLTVYPNNTSSKLLSSYILCLVLHFDENTKKTLVSSTRIPKSSRFEFQV